MTRHRHDATMADSCAPLPPRVLLALRGLLHYTDAGAIKGGTALGPVAPLADAIPAESSELVAAIRQAELTAKARQVQVRLLEQKVRQLETLVLMKRARGIASQSVLEGELTIMQRRRNLENKLSELQRRISQLSSPDEQS